MKIAEFIFDNDDVLKTQVIYSQTEPVEVVRCLKGENLVLSTPFISVAIKDQLKEETITLEIIKFTELSLKHEREHSMERLYQAFKEGFEKMHRPFKTIELRAIVAPVR